MIDITFKSTSSMSNRLFFLLLWLAIRGDPLDNDNLIEIRPPMAATLYGPVRGFYMEQGMQAFLGIPYAKPPLEELRWHPPVPPTPWGPKALNVLTMSPGCPQLCNLDSGIPYVFCPEKVDENCLYLNIWAPREANPTSNLPVVLFIHGGSFNTWSASSPVFDGRFVAEMNNVVLVSFNYRLGALGWLKTSGEDGFTGNYGIMDQRAAMRFVHENIRNFGGNPNQVTLNGQSAGAQSIAIHMTNPQTDAFFKQVILQSNPLTIPLANITEAINLSTKFSSFLNCSSNDTSCLRSKTADDIVLAQQQSAVTPINFRNPLLWVEQWGPVIDGVEILQHPLVEIAAGNVQRKPLITGVTSSESAGHIAYLFPKPPRPLSIVSILVGYFGRYTLPILQEYWRNLSMDLPPLITDVISDYIYACSSRNMTRNIESVSDQPVYHYVLNHTFEDSDVWQNPQSPCTSPGTSCHCTDLFFTFYALSLSGYKYTPMEKRLARSLIHYWGNFAHSGNPNNNDWRRGVNDITKPLDNSSSTWNSQDDEDRQILWPEYSGKAMWKSLYFKTPYNSYINDFRNEQCSLWDGVGYDGPVGPLSSNEND